MSTYATFMTTEDFAESMRIYILNPTLLCLLSPKRWAFIRGQLQLNISETRHWRELLQDSPRHLKEIERLLP